MFTIPWGVGSGASVESQRHHSEQPQGDTVTPFSEVHLLRWERNLNFNQTSNLYAF